MVFMIEIGLMGLNFNITSPGGIKSINKSYLAKI